MKSRRKFTPAFKARVSLEAVRERESLSALSSKYQLSQEQVSKWKREFLEKSEFVFTLEQPERKSEKEIQKLKEIIGDLHVQVDFLKKNL
jgi:transposase-like protein